MLKLYAELTAIKEEKAISDGASRLTKYREKKRKDKEYKEKEIKRIEQLRKQIEFNDRNSERIQNCMKRKKKANENELRKSLLSSGTHFLFQTESRTKYTKLQVLSKQVYIGEVDKEYQKSLKAMANHVSTF